jgi:hypothetical protein
VVFLDERSTWGGHAQFVHPEYYAKIAVPGRLSEKALSVMAFCHTEAARKKSLAESSQINNRHTVVGWRIAGCLGIIGCIGLVFAARTFGYGMWCAMCAVYGVVLNGVSLSYDKTAPMRFRSTIKLWRNAHWPATVALILGSAEALDRLTFPFPAFATLTACSAILFLVGIIKPIPDNVEERGGQNV